MKKRTTVSHFNPWWCIGLLLLLGAGCPRPALLVQEAKRSNQPIQIQVPAESFRNKSAVIIGDLGYPVGTPLDIEATVVEEMHPFFAGATTGDYLLKVDKVNGKELKPPSSFKFVVEYPGHKNALARDEVQFMELCSRLQKLNNFFSLKALSAAEVKAFERDYVGSRHILYVYEMAGYYGMPSPLRGMNTRAGVGFRFSTDLVVVSETKP